MLHFAPVASSLLLHVLARKYMCSEDTEELFKGSWNFRFGLILRCTRKVSVRVQTAPAQTQPPTHTSSSTPYSCANRLQIGVEGRLN